MSYHGLFLNDCLHAPHFHLELLAMHLQVSFNFLEELTVDSDVSLLCTEIALHVDAV